MGRFNTGTMTVGIFAVLFGLVGAYALRAALVRDVPPVPEPPKTINVPLANNDLPAGRKITISDMALVPMTQEMAAKRKFPLETLMVNSEQIAGRLLREPMKPGDPFLTTNCYLEGTGPDIAEKLKPGLRAFTLPIDDISSVAGAVTVGSLVDVLFRTTPRAADKANRKPEIPQATVTLLAGAEVLAVGRNEALQSRVDTQGNRDLRQSNRKDESSSAPKSITLAVTPAQAEMLQTAIGRGEFRLSMRLPSDPPRTAIEPLTLENMLGIKSIPEPFKTEIYRGSMRQSLTYEESQVVDEQFGGIPNKKPQGSNKNQDQDKPAPADDSNNKSQRIWVPSSNGGLPAGSYFPGSVIMPSTPYGMPGS